MKGSLALRPRERRLALIAGTMIGWWLLVTWVVAPLWTRASDLRHQVSAQTEKLDAVQQLLLAAPTIDQRHQQVAAFLTTRQVEQGSLLHALELASRRNQLTLNLKPRPSTQDARFIRSGVELDVEGVQANLFTFLDTLLAQPRLIAIEQLRIASVPGREGHLRARLVLQELTLR